MSNLTETVRETGGSFFENRRNDSFLKTGFQVFALAIGGYYTVKLLSSQLKGDADARAKQAYEVNANNPGTAENIAKTLSLAITDHWYGFSSNFDTVMAVFAGPPDGNGVYKSPATCNPQIYSREFLATVQGFYQKATGRDLMTDLYSHLDIAGTSSYNRIKPYLDAINCRSRRVNPTTKKIFYVNTCKK